MAHQRKREKQCKSCFEYQPVHQSKCKACGSAFNYKPTSLSIWQKIKRFLNM